MRASHVGSFSSGSERTKIGNLGLDNARDSASRLYKNAFFVDWRVADQLRHDIFKEIDFFLDLNCQDDPRMLEGKVLRDAVGWAVQRPFRVVPFFDPGPWGGDWMRQHFALPDGPPNFGMDYTQDESYYILDREEGSELYLGLREGIDPSEMRQALEDAQKGDGFFPVERFVNTWPTRKQDHFPVPPGTIHCSGPDNVVLEISATPYIFTFKLWDWGRLGLDGTRVPFT
jgi:hypothetical protein